MDTYGQLWSAYGKRHGFRARRRLSVSEESASSSLKCLKWDVRHGKPASPERGGEGRGSGGGGGGRRGECPEDARAVDLWTHMGPTRTAAEEPKERDVAQDDRLVAGMLAEGVPGGWHVPSGRMVQSRSHKENGEMTK